MKGRVVALAVVLLFGLIVTNGLKEAASKSGAEAARRSEKRSEVQALAMKWEADQEWEQRLAGAHGNRITQVLSAELQRLWIDRPSILFIGTLEDISRLPDGSFQLTLTHDGLMSSKLLIMSSFGIRVRCSETIGIALLTAHEKERVGLYSGVAVVAHIENVVQEGSGDDTKRIGVGKCLEALYLGTTRIWEGPKR